MEAIEIVPSLNKQKIKRIGKDPVKAAKAVDLIYVSDSQPGILRVRNAKNFDYVFNNRKIKSDPAF